MGSFCPLCPGFVGERGQEGLFIAELFPQLAQTLMQAMIDCPTSESAWLADFAQGPIVLKAFSQKALQFSGQFLDRRTDATEFFGKCDFVGGADGITPKIVRSQGYSVICGREGTFVLSTSAPTAVRIDAEVVADRPQQGRLVVHRTLNFETHEKCPIDDFLRVVVGEVVCGQSVKLFLLVGHKLGEDSVGH
jgi:hypothetical protein